MKITSVEFHPDGSSAVHTLSFRDPGQANPYNVKGMTGLDADEIVPRFYGASGATAFYNLMLLKRNIVALIELNPRYELDETPSSLRDELYKMIASSRKGKVEIQFKNEDDVIASVMASITKTESFLFKETPEVQISFECDEPFLKAPDPVSINVVGLDPSLTVITDSLSTAPHGLKLELSVETVVSELLIYDPDDPIWAFNVAPSGGFLVDDVIHLSSELNDKYIYVVRGGNTIHLADAIMPGSIWPIMFPGDTKLTVEDGANYDWTAISYYPTYWGV